MSKTLILVADKEGFSGAEQIQQAYGNQYNIKLITAQQGEDSFDLFGRFAQEVLADKQNLGILVSGNGMMASLIMNKTSGIRGALCHTLYLAGMTRKHNNSNVLIIGTDISTPQKYLEFVPDFMSAEFQFSEDMPQHGRRVDKMMQIEKEGVTAVLK